MLDNDAPAEGNVKFVDFAAPAMRQIDFRDVLEDLPAAIYTTDAAGRITYFNKACIELSGQTPEIGDEWCVTWKLYTTNGDRLPHSECPMAVALKERRPIRGVEAVAERPDGTRINFLPYPSPIFDERGNLLGAVNMLVDITEQKNNEAHLALMAREVSHRANNLLSIIQGFIHLTHGRTVAEYKHALVGRLAAVARANMLTSEERWTLVDLKSLVQEELAACTHAEIEIDGPNLEINSGPAQSIAMILHELCTNAIKYGGLSTSTGKVAVSWSVDDSGSLMLKWSEMGGPPTKTPRKKGTGTSVIAASVRRLGGEIFRDWQPSGLCCTLVCNANQL